jgi:hypothetical protein
VLQWYATRACCAGGVDGVAAGVVRSDRCGLDELITPYGVAGEVCGRLSLEAGWPRRWTVTWQLSGGAVVCPVRDLDSVPLRGVEPVRRFTWRARQRHRPGLHYMVSTGRHHGFESLEEQRLLLALDFLGQVTDVLSQPFRLEFQSADGRGQHIPDFLAVFGDGGRWLFDVRPGRLVKDEDAVRFAAAAEAALASGWRYSVVAGWRPHAISVLDALSAQRRELEDPLGLQAELLEGMLPGAVSFGELVAGTSLPVVARAHALHLLWHRRLGIDLSRPLEDDCLVWSAEAG